MNNIMIESITKFCELVPRLRAERANPEVLREAISAARMGWANASNAVAASETLAADEAARFDRALDEAITTVAQSGESPEFVVRLKWYQLLLRALAAGGQAAVSPLIEATRDGLILGKSLADILPDLLREREPSASITVRAS